MESERRKLAVPRSCFNCRNAVKYSGISRGPYRRDAPPVAHCTLGYQAVKEAYKHGNDDLANFYQATAEHCPYYDPMMVKACANCGEKVGEPSWSWELWAMNQAVCSEECKVEPEEQFTREVQRTQGAVDRRFPSRKRN